MADANLEQLAEMFPQFDRDVLASILIASDNSMDDAITQCMQQADGTRSENGLDADEEAAYAIFQQFAVELETNLAKEGKPIPNDIKEDPVKYQEFVMQRMQQQQESELTKRLAKHRGGKGVLSRMAKGQLFGRARPQPMMALLPVEKAAPRSNSSEFDSI